MPNLLICIISLKLTCLASLTHLSNQRISFSCSNHLSFTVAPTRTFWYHYPNKRGQLAWNEYRRTQFPRHVYYSRNFTYGHLEGWARYDSRTCHANLNTIAAKSDHKLDSSAKVGAAVYADYGNIQYWRSCQRLCKFPESKVSGANMVPIWGRQDPGGPQVRPMNFAIWVNQ